MFNRHRHMSILSNLWKIYERIIFKQMFEYFETILSKYQGGFRYEFSAQHCLVKMLEKQITTVDNKKTFGSLLTHLPKAFDELFHNHLIAKLNVFN